MLIAVLTKRFYGLFEQICVPIFDYLHTWQTLGLLKAFELLPSNRQGKVSLVGITTDSTFARTTC